MRTIFLIFLLITFTVTVAIRVSRGAGETDNKSQTKMSPEEEDLGPLGEVQLDVADEDLEPQADQPKVRVRRAYRGVTAF
uniref:Secreted protein n=1 Tax=Caenorhabditis japonica TaxID=281687 RepID=A0A8R1IF34_CAEJA